MLEVRLLGKFEITSGKKAVSLASRPAQSLLAFLILHAGTPFRREKLAGQLWPESTDEAARDYLRHALWRIRTALQSASSASYLKANDLTIAFDASSNYWLDADAVQRVSEAAAPDELAGALSAYGGELLPGFYDEWVVLERQHLQAAYERKLEVLLELLREAGRWDDVLEWGEKWIALGQKPEASFRALMYAYAAKGDRSRVVAVYERYVKAMAEYGIAPSEETRQLYQSLKSGAPPVRKEAKATTSVEARQTPSIGNVPVPLTSFVGRQKELKHIAQLLGAARLLTLTGPGGVGKTRLAIESTAGLRKSFKDGVYWVGLVGTSDPNLIPQEIANALRIHEVPPEPIIETVKSHLAAKDALLILDNCEHLIRACADYAEQLLAACPKLKILTTSIEALGLFNEVTWQVPSLPLPEGLGAVSVAELEHVASVELFRARAANANSDFQLSEANAGAVIQICQRLDGIPLALELAAARVKVLSVDEIAARLDDRFSLLTSGSRTAIPRHQTLRATIDWSHELLSEPERILFRRLAAFAGGFTLEAAEAVCSLGDLQRADLLDSLARLVDKSLVSVEPAAVAGETRYRLLETIRQYALEKLIGAGEATEIRRRHAEFFVRMAEESEPHIYGSQAGVWFRRLGKDLDNIRSAVEWSTACGEAEMALRIMGSLVYFWFARGVADSEWNDRVREAFACPKGTERTLARAKALNGIGFMYWANLYPTGKRAELEEAFAIATEHGDLWNTAMALRNLGLHENLQGNYAEARTFLERSIEIWTKMGPSRMVERATALLYLGDVALNQADRQWARSIFEECSAILREADDLNFLAYSSRRLAQLAWLDGDLETAVSQCAESLRLNQEAGDPRGVIACIAGFAAIAMARSDHERAGILLAAVESQLAAVSVRVLYADRLEYERNLARLREVTSKRVLDKLWARGAALSLEEAIKLALQDA